ncbi:sensor histidine kinase [Desulfohalovibrio reitneri]|uniref:sensor histidine kinase n=1 Tax=Desulfohalovibrio reitneri TaxID=1307759 RepID=UPI0004A707EE|nr:sensor histidine kinase [Desulfohalovibrio reitneri]
MKEYIRIPLVYVAFSVFWIVFSDAAVFWLFGAGDESRLAQTVKGTAFVLLSGGLLFYLSRKQFRTIVERNQRLSEVLRGQRALVQEIHHRVKNNLQVVISLLSLQRSKSEDDQAIEVLQECEGRIRSIAQVHNLLYADGEPGSLDLSLYIRKLGASLPRTYGLAGRVEMDVRGGESRVAINEAVSIGLIINELITNSCKYAFHERGQGSVSVELTNENSGLTLTYRDNGPGLDDPGLVESDHTLGFHLVRLLTRQLNGTYALLEKPGLAMRFHFPLDE